MTEFKTSVKVADAYFVPGPAVASSGVVSPGVVGVSSVTFAVVTTPLSAGTHAKWYEASDDDELVVFVEFE